MPDPVQSSSSSSVSAGYYDVEGGQCVAAEPPAPPVCAKPEAPTAACASEAGPSQAAVKSLVRSQVEKGRAESCATKLISATLDCTKAAITVAAAAVSEGSVGALAVLSVGDCGLGTVEAYRCLARSD